MSAKNIGKLCRIGMCDLIYEIEGYSEKSGEKQYLLRARQMRDHCLYFGWISADEIHLVSEAKQ